MKDPTLTPVDARVIAAQLRAAADYLDRMAGLADTGGNPVLGSIVGEYPAPWGNITIERVREPA